MNAIESKDGYYQSLKFLGAMFFSLKLHLFKAIELS